MFRIKCHYPYLNAIICFHFYIFTRHYSNVTDFLFACFKKKSGMELLRTHRDGMLQDYYVRLLGFILWKVRSCCFLFLSPLKKTNKQTKTGEYLKSQFSPESIQTPLTLCVIFTVWKKEEKSASTFSTFMFFEADCCFLSVKQHSIPDQILFQYTPTTRSLIRVIGMCTLTHL